eukprot:5286746-Prymnesium_polylepis.1
MLSHSPPASWPAAPGSSRGSHSPGPRTLVGTCAYHLNPFRSDLTYLLEADQQGLATIGND